MIDKTNPNTYPPSVAATTSRAITESFCNLVCLTLPSIAKPSLKDQNHSISLIVTNLILLAIARVVSNGSNVQATCAMPPVRSTITSMNITFLGTASAQPSSTRNHSSLALRLGGDVWLFDCGEATQHQIQKSGVKMGKIEKIFITHTHG
jgi:hypothetical protein